MKNNNQGERISLKGLLFEDKLLVINPRLAQKIGLNEAIVLQQILYWVKNDRAGEFINGYKWIYNSIPQWSIQFPFWSEATIKRTLASLRDKGCIVADQLSKDPRDKTLYYRLSDDLIDDLSIGSICTDGQGQNDPMTIYTKTTTNKVSKSGRKISFEKWPNEPSQELWADFEKVRKSKRAPVTQRVVDNLGREITKAKAIGMSVDDCMNELLDRGWSTFRFDWVNKKQGFENQQPVFRGQTV